MFDLAIPNQSGAIQTKLQANLYRLTYRGSQKTKWVRLAAPGIALTAGLIDIAMRVSLIGEAILKGFGNLFGAIGSKKCSFKAGLSNLFLQFPKHLILLPFTILSAPISLVMITVRFAAHPEAYARSQWCKYDPQEKKLQIEKEDFQAIEKLFEKNPNDIEVLKKYAASFTLGVGTKKDDGKAHALWKMGAEKGDFFSMKMLAMQYREGIGTSQNPSQALHWYKNAAEKGDPDAMMATGHCYLLEKNFAQALTWYGLATRKGHPDGYNFLQRALEEQSHRG